MLSDCLAAAAATNIYIYLSLSLSRSPSLPPSLPLRKRRRHSSASRVVSYSVKQLSSTKVPLHPITTAFGDGCRYCVSSVRPCVDGSSLGKAETKQKRVDEHMRSACNLHAHSILMPMPQKGFWVLGLGAVLGSIVLRRRFGPGVGNEISCCGFANF